MPAPPPRRLACALALAACNPPVLPDSHPAPPPSPASPDSHLAPPPSPASPDSHLAPPPSPASPNSHPAPPPSPALPASPSTAAAQRDACLARHKTAPARYQGLLRAFCSEHAHLGGVGAVLAIAERGALAYTATLGQRCIGRDLVDGDTPFRIGSLTKLLTAALVLDLADDHLLDLDAPLLELAAHPDLRARAITPRQLLTHTSGLPDLAPHDLTAPWPRALAERPLWTPPGAVWSYSNAGYALLGAALERITDQPYEALLTARLLTPLALHHTTADRDHAVQILHAACGHLGRAPHALALDVHQDLELGARGATWTVPAGGVIASAPDLVTLALALADPARSPLSPAARAALFTATTPTHERPHEHQAPALRTEPLPDGAPLYRLAGHTGDFTADLSFAPDRGFVLVLLTNTAAPLRATLAAAHHDLLGQSPHPAPPAPPTAYAGRYTLPDGPVLTISDTLELTYPPNPPTPLRHLGDHRFHSDTPPNLYTFVFTADPAHATHLRTRTFVATHTAQRRLP